MIDWVSLAFNALWILAAALAFAAISHAGWDASRRGETLPQSLGRFGYQQVLWLAVLIFCVGQAGVAAESWRLATWAVLAVLSLGALLLHRRAQK